MIPGLKMTLPRATSSLYARMATNVFAMPQLPLIGPGA